MGSEKTAHVDTVIYYVSKNTLNAAFYSEAGGFTKSLNLKVRKVFGGHCVQ